MPGCPTTKTGKLSRCRAHKQKFDFRQYRLKQMTEQIDYLDL